MSQPQTRMATPPPGVRQAAPPPMGHGVAGRAALSVPGPSDLSTDAPVAARSWWGTGFRVLRDVAIGFTLIAAIPLASIRLLGASDWTTNSTHQRVREVERLRPLMAARDAAITPLVAGEALYRLAPPQGHGIAMRPVVPDALPWVDAPPAAGLFADHRSARWGGPDATMVIERASRGYSAAEVAWLKMLATAPLWRDVELAARAARIDIDGARLAKPWSVEDPKLFPPTTALTRLRQIADAGVARAAYHVAQHDYAEADAALRIVVSLGFAFVDNGTTFYDALTGRVLIDIGRAGLHQLSAIDGRRDVFVRSVPFRSNPRAQRIPIAQREADAVALLADATLSRAFRFEQYGLMAYSTCGSVSKVLTGFTDHERAIIQEARRTLPRFDSERAMLEWPERRMEWVANAMTTSSPLSRIVVGAAEVTSAITRNPRIATCTRFAVARQTAY